MKSSSLSDEAKYDVLHELNVKHTQFNDALALALSLSIDATVTSDQTTAIPQPNAALCASSQPNFPMAIPGQKFRVLVHMADDGSAAVNIEMCNAGVGRKRPSPRTVRPAKTSGPIDGGGILNTLFTVQIPADAGLYASVL